MKKFLAVVFVLSFVASGFAQDGSLSDINSQNYVNEDGASSTVYDPENPVLTGTEGAKVFASDPFEGITFPLVVYFGPDAVDFSKPDLLDEELTAQNAAIFEQVIALLNDNPEYRLVIEGHANVVLQTKAELKVLDTMSLQRAQAVAQYLMEGGIERKSLIVAFAGGSLPLESFDNHDGWYKNRRVELSFAKNGETVAKPTETEPAADSDDAVVVGETDTAAAQPLA
ncbi:MAG: hypothetical protein Ta2A_24580 [Treponemataceae bacterium]|nr:MAG: hypothetical protein Ta2A_24580 [Treponemataceae bacterium]